MRGFLVGSLVLIAGYALLQPNAASSAQSASGVLVGLLRRALSGEVAGVPNRAKGTPATTEPPLPPSQGGPGIPVPGN